MSSFKSIEEIYAWKYSRALSKRIYDLIHTGSFARDYPLRDQISRSTGSIMDNIAEGFERGGNREFLNFLSYARGSCGELRSQLARALDRNHISEETFDDYNSEAKRVGSMLTNLMTYLLSTDIRGFKFYSPSTIRPPKTRLTKPRRPTIP